MKEPKKVREERIHLSKTVTTKVAPSKKTYDRKGIDPRFITE